MSEVHELFFVAVVSTYMDTRGVPKGHTAMCHTPPASNRGVQMPNNQSAPKPHFAQRKGLGDWGKLQVTWQERVIKYCEDVLDDSPWAYTERANVGMLAAAAWQLGGVALEEFQHPRSEGAGRCDL